MKKLSQENNKVKSKKLLLIFVLTIISILGVVLSVGKFICAPWNLYITANNIVSEKFGDDYGVLVDDAGNRLSIYDKDYKISQIKNSYTTNDKLYFYETCCFNNDYLFVNEYCYHKDTNFLSEEKIAKYNRDGTKISDFAIYSYDLDDNYTNTSRIQILSLSDDKLYYTYYDSLNNSYSINSVNLFTEETAQETNLMKSFPDPTSIPSVNKIGYNYSTNQLNVIDRFGNIYIAHLMDSNFTKVQDNIVDNYNLKGEYALIDYANLNDSDFIYLEDNNIEFNFILAFRIIYFWLSVIFLICVTIAFLILSLKKVHVKELSKKCKVPLIICLCFAISIGVIIFINNNNMELRVSANDNELTQNLLLTKEYIFNDSQKLINADLDSVDFKNIQQTVSQKLQHMSLISARSSMSSNLILCKLEGDKFIDIANSISPSLFGMNSYSYDPNLALDEHGVARSFVNNVLGNYRFATTYIYDNNSNLIGSIVCYSNYDTSSNLIKMDRLSMMTSIASALIVLSFLLMEAISWFKSFTLRKKKTIPKQIREEISITVPLYFLCTAAASADLVIGVLVFSDMLSDTVFEGNMFIISLPLTCKALGNTAGIILFPRIRNKIGTKNTLLLASIGACVCLVLSAFFVFSCKIFLVSASLFMASLLRQLIWMYLNDIPVHVQDSNMRKELNNKCSASSICGSALITVIAGYASDAFGGWTVYICAAIPIFIVMTMILIFLPRLCFLDNAKNKTKEKIRLKSIFKFIFRLDIFLLICSAFVISILIGGYKSFIFPLIANMNGMSNSDVSNISVFANAIAFYIIPLFTYVQKRVGNIKVLFSVEIIIGLLFVLFALNSSFVWACLVYFIVQMLYKLIWPGANDYWQNIAQKNNIDSNIALTSTTLASNTLDLLKNSIMGILMGVGSIFACIVIGVYSIVSSLLFGIYGKKNNLTNNNAQDEIKDSIG